VIVGGALAGDNAEVYQAILGARSGSGPFCVFPTASAEPESSLESAVSRFDGHGGAGTAKGIFLTVDSAARASDPAVAEEIRGCSGFFFVGGVQTRIVEVFRPGGVDSPALEALRERFQAGAVISGSSAGAAIMTDPMIGGGDSGEALQSGIRVGEEGEGVVMEPGLGFLDGVQVDQHHLARGRWGRLVVALLGTPGDQLGFGIDENTALWVRGDTARVVGASGVLFLDVRAAAREEGGFGGSGIGLHLLGAGDQVLLSSGAVRVHGEKGALSSTGTPFQGAAELDLFGRRVLQGVLTQFATATDASLSFTQGGQVIELRKGEGFQARALPAAAAAAEAEVAAQRAPGPRALYAGPFLLSVRREGATSSAGGADAP
jgi:cyanophycinase